MRPQDVVARQVQLRRAQRAEGGGAWRQADLAERLGRYGVHMDPTQVGRLESGSRGVKVDDLLALAAALMCTPADLLVPPEGEKLTMGPHWSLDADQVRTWVSGRRSWIAALRAPLRATDLQRQAFESTEMHVVLESLETALKAIEAGDPPVDVVQPILSVIRILSAMAQRFLEWDDEADQ